MEKEIENGKSKDAIKKIGKIKSEKRESAGGCREHCSLPH